MGFGFHLVFGTVFLISAKNPAPFILKKYESTFNKIQ